MGGISISLCMIVKDEEDSLPNCLASVRELVDEMIIIDTGSKDNTKQIASAFTDHVYDFEWIDDFSAARNFAFSKATKEYILWLDADDILTEENKEKFSTLKKELPPHFDSVMMFYHLSFDGNGNPSFSSRRNRLVKREKNFQWIGFVHEYLEVTGHTFQSDIAIHHKKEKSFNDRNLRIYKKALQSGMDFNQEWIFHRATNITMRMNAMTMVYMMMPSSGIVNFLMRVKDGVRITFKPAASWRTVIFN